MPTPLLASLIRYRRRALWWTLALASLCTVVLLAAWGVQSIFAQREQSYRHRVEGSVLGINLLQAQSVSHWRTQLLSDAAQLSDDGLLGHAAAQWLAQPGTAAVQPLMERLRSLQEQGRYSRAYLVDPQAALRLSAQGAAAGGLPAPEQAALATALREAQPAIVEVRQDSTFAYPFWGLLAPLFDGEQAVGAIWLVVDVRAALYPLLQNWPTSSRTAESFLLQRTGTQVHYITPLRSDKKLLGAALALHDTQDVAAQAAHGLTGTLYGHDVTGTSVLAAAYAVPGSPWLLVSKINTDDAFSDIERSHWLIAALLLCLVLLTAGCATALWQWRARRREQLLQRQLERNLRWLETAQKAATVGYFAYDEAAQNFFLSSMASRIFGLPEGAVMPLAQWLQMLHPQERKAILQSHAQAMQEGQPLRTQYRIQRASDGATRWLQVWGEHEEVVLPRPGHPAPVRMSGTVQDITERKTTEQSLEDYRHSLEAQVRLDALTQIANRMALNEATEREWARAAIQGRPLALLMLDVDYFKHYNDHYGHVAGDQCLQRVALALATHTQRNGELVARYGGEEFAVLLPACDGPQALKVARRLRYAVQSLALEHSTSPCEPVVTISIGVASTSVPPDPDASALGIRTLFEQADTALYRAKQAGRNQAMLFTA